MQFCLVAVFIQTFCVPFWLIAEISIELFRLQYQNREYFMQFVTEDIDSYVSRKRNNHVHGNHIEIQAISEIFNRPVEIYAYHTGEYGRTNKFLLLMNVRN